MIADSSPKLSIQSGLNISSPQVVQKKNLSALQAFFEFRLQLFRTFFYGLLKLLSWLSKALLKSSIRQWPAACDFSNFLIDL